MKISTHAPLAGRDKRISEPIHNSSISTHAPLAGRDTRHIQRLARAFYFNPRAPCGARPLRTYKYRGRQGFQPTRPLRGATRFACLPFGTAKFQPTRPLRGATESPTCKPEGSLISTHAPLAGRDAVAEINAVTEVTFQPTRPLRGATRFHLLSHKVHQISTHAPLAGRDSEPSKLAIAAFAISTHAPLAGRDNVS